MLWLLRYILGYVRFSVKGEFPERLFNQLSARNVKLWEMKRKNGVLTACISARNYLKMRKFKGKNRVCTRVLERHGLPFLIKRYHLRLGVPIGALLYIAILIFLSSFVWNIEVCGNETIETKKIIS
ncbi:MAG: sporulation protein YqfD, partial [Clostridia bacterium]|nr:sporulation protein YqfD [Clostridia bacterium]